MLRDQLRRSLLVHQQSPKREVGDLTFPENALFDVNTYQVRYYQHWLLGVDNGIMDEPAVQYYVLGDVTDPGAPGNEWRRAVA